MSRPARHIIAAATLDMLDKGTSTTKIARELAEYLITERRTRELAGLIRDIEKLRLNRHDILEIEVSSVHELSEQTERQLMILLHGRKTTIIDTQLESSLIGGVRVTALDRQLDLSYKTRLNQLKHVSPTSS